MKKMLVLLATIFVVGCGGRNLDINVTAKDGANGRDGADGKNGHSIVTEYSKVSEIECESSSGSRLDMYIDLDDTLTVTEADLYSNSLVVCNGLNGQKGDKGDQGLQGNTGAQGPQGVQGLIGPQGVQGVAGVAGPIGPQGPQGPQGLVGATGATGPAGSGATIVSYTSSSCTKVGLNSVYTKKDSSSKVSLYSSSSCSSSSRVAEISSGESYWISSTALGTNNDGSLRVINFN